MEVSVIVCILLAFCQQCISFDPNALTGMTIRLQGGTEFAIADKIYKDDGPVVYDVTRSPISHNIPLEMKVYTDTKSDFSHAVKVIKHLRDTSGGNDKLWKNGIAYVENYLMCAKHSVLVMPKIDLTVQGLISTRRDFVQTNIDFLDFFEHLYKSLRFLHNAGVAYGSVSVDDVGVNGKHPYLIDFDRSKLYPNKDFSDQPIYSAIHDPRYTDLDGIADLVCAFRPRGIAVGDCICPQQFRDVLNSRSATGPNYDALDQTIKTCREAANAANAKP